ncbi:hypothetical protein GCM10027275_45620 [Rhabdobacter roseus]|uniref:Deoxyribose-phosphate aldolase n=1 Tax=Rhabdobacter roseus TaxID=1655419 RepID=A0A840U3T4_9BACT|nr:DUF6503 family protein [Rhabdobacter roseus]MBB5286770.1 hypothetical protein [Rhabdobacter roseus]
MRYPLLLLLSGILFSGCQPSNPAQRVVDQAIEAHGGRAYDRLTMEFDFRDKHYIVQKNGGAFRYERVQTDSTGAEIKDILTNTEAYRTRNGQRQNVPDTTMDKYKYSVNSVAYFVLLPQPLNDPAVQKEYLGEVTIKGKPYHKIKVTFGAEGGGKDHDDVFVYWFGRDDSSLDYLAYLYYVDETGLRFREVINRQKVGGIVVQDYRNYAPADSALAVREENLLKLDALFEAGQLKVLSTIEKKNVRVQ